MSLGTAGTGTQLLATAGLFVAAVVLRVLVAGLLRLSTGGGPVRREGERRRFWVLQASHALVLALLLGGIAYIWLGEAGRFATVAGLATAGVAVALQRVITSFAAYLIILRGRVFAIGDRITIGGVRGDVVAVGFMQTSVMEMGESPSVQSGDPKVWVAARQYTGRLVSVTNDKIFDTPVFNYTREFPYLWEELSIPIRYDADRGRAEEILLEAARHRTSAYSARAEQAIARLRARFLLSDEVGLDPRVFLRLTDNWIELAVRFIAPVHGVRVLKDAMSREIVEAFEGAGIQVASATYEIVGLPALRLGRARD